MVSASVEKDVVLLTGFDFHLSPVVKPQLQLMDSAFRNRHQPLLSAFSVDADEALWQEEVAELEVGELRDTQATGEKHLDNGTVAVPFIAGQVDTVLQSIHFLGGQILRQMLWQMGRLQQFCWVNVEIAVQDQVTIERAHTAEDACLRLCADAMIGKHRREVLQIFELDAQRVNSFLR